MKQNYTERVEAFLGTFLAKEGFVCLKTEFVEEEHNWYLRVYIDLSEEEREKRGSALSETRKNAEEAACSGEFSGEEAETPEEGDGLSAEEAESEEPGVGINDCANVSRRLSKWLDKEDFITEMYTLEVCSRGFLE